MRRTALFVSVTAVVMLLASGAMAKDCANEEVKRVETLDKALGKCGDDVDCAEAARQKCFDKLDKHGCDTSVCDECQVDEDCAEDEECDIATGECVPMEADPCATNSIGIEFTPIEAGTFEMGSTAGAIDEEPVHTVEITQDFCLGTYEVTQAQWVAVMGSNPSGFSSCGGDCPVEQVSWTDVQAFITALNSLEGTTAYRLPTEAEWEYAARAGTTTEWSWGSNAGDAGTYAWYFDNSGSTTHPVGGKLANPWGLYDMHGNVWEWVQDWYDLGYYSVSPAADPPGPASGSRRVNRGGGWSSSLTFLRSADRALGPVPRVSFLGFRLLRAGL